MMKKAYESPEFESVKFSFEATLQSIQYSQNEDYHHGGNEGDDDAPPG